MKAISGLSGTNYKEKLKELGLPSLRVLLLWSRLDLKNGAGQDRSDAEKGGFSTGRISGKE